MFPDTDANDMMQKKISVVDYMMQERKAHHLKKLDLRGKGKPTIVALIYELALGLSVALP